MSLDTNNPEALRQAWDDLKAKEPRLYTRDAAKKLGASEAQLIALRCPESAQRLQLDDLCAFLSGAMQFGQVMVLVRNEAAVLEMDGVLQFEAKEHHIAGTAANMQLVVSPKRTVSAFAVQAEEWLKRGVMLFDVAGDAVLKIYFRDAEKIAEIDAWLEKWKSPDQSCAQKVSPLGECVCPHHAAADTGAVIPVEKSYKPLLEAATKSGDSVTVSVGNTGCYLSATSPIKKVAAMGPWFNILDKELHMHLSETTITRASVTADAEKKSTTLVLKNAAGDTVLRIGVPSDGDAAKVLLA